MDMPQLEMDRAIPRPRTNISESESDIRIEMLTPGLRKEDMKISVDDRTLTVAVSRKQENATSDRNYIRREFSVTDFQRSFRLSEDADLDNVSAEFTDGVLRIGVPKRQEAKRARQVMIA